jgi:hypothetical protein
MIKKRFVLLLCMTLFLTSFGVAQVTMDISGISNEAYSIGDELRFTALVIELGEKVREEVSITISDVKESQSFNEMVPANTEYVFTLEDGLPSGIWNIQIEYKDETFEKSFTIKEKSSVEFDIEGDTLIITNTGNVRYQKTIEITIGETKQSKTLNIPIGEEREWKLIAPEGTYDILITDGETSISRKNIQLFGTGNVVGAVDEGLVGYSGFGSTPSESLEDRFISLNKLPLSIVFVVVIFGLGILIAIERATKRR